MESAAEEFQDGTETQTDLFNSDIIELESTVSKLQAEVSKLKEQLNNSVMRSVMNDELQKMKVQLEDVNKKLINTRYDEQSFIDNNEKVRFYTGLSNWDILHLIFKFVEPNLKQRSNLTPFQQLLLCLMRLRLNLSGTDLAYRFQVSGPTVSRTFLHVLNVLYVKLKSCIIWPDRDSLYKTMPMDFRKNSPKCVVIIDCFEVFIDRPTSLLARAQTYSSYKHHNTIKYLIGITPQGTVSFIAEGWGGRVSDKHLTEHSRLLNNLLPGDTVLADRGFDIKDSVGVYCANLTIPAFTKGKDQLSGIEVEQTRKIANVRIHVERVIGNIRQKFSLLSATQPIEFVAVEEETMVPTLNKIVHVACALINLCDSVIPFD